MVMWMSTLDEQLADMRDRISELDENAGNFDEEMRKCVAWAEILIKAKEIRDGINYSSIMQQIPAHMKVLNFS